MALRWADRLRAARQGLFVGRDEERALFQQVLTAPMWPFQVLFVFGPGGIGKTALLDQFAHMCEQAQVHVIQLDARTIEPTPDAFLAALQRALGSDTASPPLPPVDTAARQVLFIDTYELLTPLESWLRDTVFPHLPTQVLVVLAGRQPPTAAWRADPGWQTLLRVVPLRNLSPDESRRYLDHRALDRAVYEPVVAFTHGHPLALSLFADVLAQRPTVRLHPTDAPDVIRILVEHLVQRVPGPTHRAALEVCALVRLTSEGLLAEVLQLSDAHDLFLWLCGLSCIELRPQGLFPHDLAREALHTDLRWRNPDWYAELHRRIRAYYGTRLHHAQGLEQQRTLVDYIYLHRDNSVVRPFFEWQAHGSALLDRMRADDVPALLAMVRAHEGEEAAGFARHWMDEQPQHVLVARDTEQQPVGLLIEVALHEASSTARTTDPATRAAWSYLEHHAPLRVGEGATISRFWMAAETYQAISPTQSVIGVAMVRQYLTTPGLAFSFLPCSDPDFWQPLCAYTEFTRIPKADFHVGGRRFGVYGHDWRTLPPLAWLALLGERELATVPAPVPTQHPAVLVLSQPAFEAAVKAALQQYTNRTALQRNPLVRSRLVAERVGATATIEQRITVLQTVLHEAVETLQGSPRQLKLYRALYHTYLQPAATQEQAAELLDVPFSSYRRHLKAGITHVTALLWQAEVQGYEPEQPMRSF